MDENIEPESQDIQKIGDPSSSTERERGRFPPDRLLSAVANEHRRAVINSLNSASDKTLEYEALVERVANSLWDDGMEYGSDEHHRRVQIKLHHTHLPKLEEVQIIDYETETGLVQFVGGELEQDLLTVIEPYDSSE